MTFSKEVIDYPVKMLGLDQRGRLYRLGVLIDCPTCKGREGEYETCNHCGGEGMIYATDAHNRKE